MAAQGLTVHADVNAALTSNNALQYQILQCQLHYIFETRLKFGILVKNEHLFSLLFLFYFIFLLQILFITNFNLVSNLVGCNVAVTDKRMNYEVIKVQGDFCI